MSWSLGGVGTNTSASGGAGGAGGTASQVSNGQELEDIQTDGIGFLTIAGETKVKLLPQPWPSDRFPPPTASLLSVSSSKGLLAAASPEVLVIATTDSVRQAYTSDVPEENGSKSFTPLTTIQIPRVSQVAFSADGSCLVIAAEEGGGLAVYDVQAIQQGQKDPAFQLATNGIPVRALAPNPAPEFSHLFAVILAGGQLLMADLKDRKLVSGPQGAYFKEGTGCVSWSAKGKQMVAGLEDGTAAQFDHQGSQKASIPAPPGLQSPLPMTTVYWLANDDFLTIHTPVNTDQTDSIYHLMQRDKASGSFSASKFIGDPTPAFGLRNPAHHFISRLKSFPPSLDDMLIVASTAGTDVGVFSRSTTALTADSAAEKVVNRYTTTGMSNDSRRAQMPMSSDGMGDTSPIGMCLDLSSKDLVKRPLPSDDMEETASPVPALMILDNEGRLSTWWVMYTDSIRQKTAYPGLVSVQAQATPATHSGAFQSTPSTASTQQQATPAFGSSAFGQPARPAFGSANTPGFGNASSMGSKQSPWGTSSQASQPMQATQATPSFGKPAFGSTIPLGAATTNSASGGASGVAAFGSSSGLARSSPWGTAAPTSQTGGATFGQISQFGSATNNQTGGGFAKFGAQSGSPFAVASGSNASAGSPFASLGGNKGTDSSKTSSQSPFSSFGGSKAADGSHASSQSPFANLGGDKPVESPFASLGGDKPAQSPFATFGSGSGNKDSPFASFGQPKVGGGASQSASGSGSAFTSNKESTFGQTSTAQGSGFSFGKPSNLEASAVSVDMMDDDTSNQAEKAQTPEAAEKEAEKPSAFSNFKLVSGFKGDGTAKDDLPKSQNSGASLFGAGFGNMLGEASKTPATPEKQEAHKLPEPSATPASLPKHPTSLFNFKNKEAQKTPVAEDAPLPPDFTAPSKKEISKVSFDDIPLPPDPTPKASANPTSETKGTDDAPLPPDFVTSKRKESEDKDLPPIAGSPPVVVEDSSSELSPIASGEEADEDNEDHEDDEDLEGEDEDEEGLEEEDEEWEDETGGEQSDDDVSTPQVTQQNINKASTTPFGSRLTFPSTVSTTEKPAHSPMPSTTPAGLPKGPIFAPPQKESPRSPSPIRSISTPAVRSTARQVPNQPITLQPRPQANTSARPASAVRSQKPAPPKPEESETTDLSDDEDARIRAILESEIQPTKILDPFIAHQDYVGDGDKPGLGGQIENVYRDINSMIDTLGLNARSLEAFIRGHKQFVRQPRRELSDLDDEDDWCLVEADSLEHLEDSIDKSLEQKKLTDIPSMLANISSLLTDTIRLRARAHEVRRQVTLQSDPEKRAAQRAAPLDTETEMKQSSLRQTMTRVTKLLQEAEEQSSVLRAELASAQKSASTDAAPTVEAVTNTILKMTAMIEQKSGDVDVLESQIRRLPHGVAGLSLGADEEDEGLRSSVSSLRSSTRRLPASRSMNALATPAGLGRAANRRSIAGGAEKLGMSGMLGSRFRTPPRPGTARMEDVSPEEIRGFNVRQGQRRRVLAALRETVEGRGTRRIVVGGNQGM
ncbi:hypothetical protein K461DRAFT_8655 [Myriangium duriaei CBS 260.36]|uniref:Nucleoporin Nup159/Nup146 N-terminal domain-containing protein n=1 Tax=Myriangium duriaei CBS 260.36 TaxID=1168546 RepID=A0A9P4JDF3_9PEZI|nr:hypothetical protein K461DRAFT_8655 [Myriangium duriaei CBS 260.36]